jgi:hypothetical protein
MNNGIERQNKDFKSSFLSVHRNKTLSGMLTSLVEEFLPVPPSPYRRVPPMKHPDIKSVPMQYMRYYTQ